MTYYTCKAIEELVNQYYDVGGHVYELEEGTLGYGLMVLHASGYKTAVVREVALNVWSSGHAVRFYETCPKKYAQAVCEKYDVLLPNFIPEGMELGQYLGRVLLPNRANV